MSLEAHHRFILDTMQRNQDIARNIINELEAENARLKAENERLRKAGDAMQKRLIFLHDRWDSDEPNIESDAWNAAKEGK
jgi:cell division protein FtsB